MDTDGDVVLYDYTGERLKTTNPDLDPNFLKGWLETIGGATSAVHEISRLPYAKHPWVYAAVHAIVTNISGLEVVLNRKNKPETLIREHPIIELFRRPNGLMNGSEFFEAVLLNLLLPTSRTPGGQCFILPADENGNNINLLSGVLPTYLFPFSDEQIEVRKDTKDTFIGWTYNHPSGKRIEYTNDELIRIRQFNPYNWFLGLSPYSAAMITTAIDSKATELAEKYFDNSANIGGILKTETKLTDKQANSLKSMWQSQYEGWSKAGKTALLHSGLEFDQTARSLVDLQFKDLKQSMRDVILAVYGVPKTVLGLTDTVNRSTAKTDKEIFWEDTLLPLIKKLWLGLNAGFISYQETRRLRGGFDLTNVQPLKKDVSAKVKDAHRMIDDGVPAAEAYRVVALPVEVEKYPWLKEPLVLKPRVNLRTGETIGKAEGKVEELQLSEDVKERFWKHYSENILMKPTKEFKTSLIKFFVNQRNTFQDKADEWLKNGKGNKNLPVVCDLVDFLISQKDQEINLFKIINPIYQDIIDYTVLSMQEELEGLNNFKSEDKFFQKIKIDVATFLSRVNKAIFEGLSGSLHTIIKDNIPVQQLTKKIKGLETTFFNERISSAQHIAKTQVAGIASRTRYEVMKIEGVERHQWITAGDEKQRIKHYNEDNSVVNLGDAFINVGVKYPGEIKEDNLDEVINCTCVTIPV